MKYFVRVDELQEQIQIVSDMYLQAASSSDPLRVSLLDGTAVYAHSVSHCVVLEDLVNTYNAFEKVSLLPRPELEVQFHCLWLMLIIAGTITRISHAS